MSNNEDYISIPVEERPFKVIGGQKWVLAEDQHIAYEGLPEPEIMRKLGRSPREVPFSTWLVLRFEVGGVYSIGWFFTAFGLAFALIPLVFLGVDDLVHRNWTDAGNGTITKVEKTNTSVNDENVYAYHFRLDSPEDEPIEAVSYAEEGKFAEGDEVEIERCGNRYRAKGTTLGMAGGLFTLLFSGFSFIFAGIGLAFLINAYIAGGKTARLLREGECTKGILDEITATGTQINNQTVMKAVFSYQIGGSSYTVVAKAIDTSWLEDEPCETILYNPINPGDAVVYDGLSKKLRFDDITRRFSVSFGACLSSLIWMMVIGGLFSTNIWFWVAAFI